MCHVWYSSMNLIPYTRVGEQLVGFQDVAFLPYRASFKPHFLRIVQEVKASRSSHVLKLCIGVSNGVLPMKYFRSSKASLRQMNCMEIIRLIQR